MNQRTKRWIFASVVTFLIIALFILSSYITKTYTSQIDNLLKGNYYIGIIIYIFLGIIDATGIPITNIALIPIVVSIYGFYLGTFLTIIGWFIGSLIAFFIARKYGREFVEKIISLKKIESMQKFIPGRGLFFSSIFFRVLLPHDFVNYGYGIFTVISKKSFIVSSLIGIIFSSFMYSYLGILPLTYEILIIFTAIILFILIIYFYPKFRKKCLFPHLC